MEYQCRYRISGAMFFPRWWGECLGWQKVNAFAGKAEDRGSRKINLDASQINEISSNIMGGKIHAWPFEGGS